MKQYFAAGCLALASLSAHAGKVVCSEPGVQGGFAATVSVSSRSLVVLSIPQGESGPIRAIGRCVAEEDTTELSLRCENVSTREGYPFFFRIDGETGTVAQGGRILARLSCRAAAEDGDR